MRLAYAASLGAVAFAAAVMVTGAYITSSEIVARQTQSSFVANETLHRVLGVALVLAAIWLAYLVRGSPIGWIGGGIVTLDAAIGWHGAPLSPGVGVVHALLAHLYFSTAVVGALMASAYWKREPEMADGGHSFLRPLAAATPPVVLIQITLGALYRHNVIGIILHVAVAMAVALLALILSSSVLQNCPRPASLRLAAGTLMGVVLVQVSFGIASLVMLLLNFTATGYFIAATVTHVLIGASTLAASVVMAMEVWRSVPRAPNT